MHSVNMTKAFVDMDLPAVVRLAAHQATQAGGYMKPGAWLKQLHTYDLRSLMMMIDDVGFDLDNPASKALVALAMILVQAEGLEIGDGFQGQVNQLGLFLTTESLARKGLVEVYYDNISFGDDAGELQIARALT